MKRKTKIRVNRAVTMVLTLALILCQVGFLTGCGKKDLDRNKEQIEEVLPDGMDVDDIADMLDEGMDADEIIDSVTEIKDGSVVTTDKPSGAAGSSTTTATATPAPTETPKPMTTPEPTATPESTPTPHVHQWTESVTRAAGCASEGEKKLVCECGETKVEVIPATGAHNWVEGTTVIHHEALGHVEEVQVQTGTSAGYTIYACGVCGAEFNSPSEKTEHCKEYIAVDGNHAGARTVAYDYPGEPIYEVQSQWIVDQPAWDEVVGTGTYTCSECGAAK